jgi:hypothetical protein
MQDSSNKNTLFADDVGIHFQGVRNKDIVVVWGEIAQICAVRMRYADNTPFIQIHVDHISGVDFRFQDSEAGYEQVMREMEKHLIGFTRSALEAVGSLEVEADIPIVWKREESLQPFQVQQMVIDPRDPTPEESIQMDAARRATIETCEKKLGRPLNSEERECVCIGFENGRIVGHVKPPLCNLLIEHQ